MARQNHPSYRSFRAVIKSLQCLSGYHKSDLTLDDRHWVCPECNTEHDRDINAALNIKKIALKNSVFPACGGIKPVDLLSKEKGMKQEVAVG